MNSNVEKSPTGDNNNAWKWILGGLAIAGLILVASKNVEDEEVEEEVKTKKRKKKLFISFAIEDQKYRDFLVGQANLEHSPFDFMDMSVKEPWDEAVWKRRCREKIRECDGLIVLLSKNTWHSSGARWEIKCAIEEGLKVIGMHVKHWDQGAVLPELDGKRVIKWNWENLKKFINRL